MNREVHVRVCEGLRGKFPRSTRLLILFHHNSGACRSIVSIDKNGLQREKPTTISGSRSFVQMLGLNSRYLASAFS